MSELKHLNLTERDFDLIIEGLSEIPNKGAVGELMSGLLEGVFCKTEAERENIIAKRKYKQHQKEKEQKYIKEEISILQGKLLMLKRYLASNDALSKGVDILNNFS